MLTDLLIARVPDLAHELLELRVLAELAAKVCALRGQPQHAERQADAVLLIKPLERAREPVSPLTPAGLGVELLIFLTSLPASSVSVFCSSPPFHDVLLSQLSDRCLQCLRRSVRGSAALVRLTELLLELRDLLRQTEFQQLVCGGLRRTLRRLATANGRMVSRLLTHRATNFVRAKTY